MTDWLHYREKINDFCPKLFQLDQLLLQPLLPLADFTKGFTVIIQNVILCTN